VLYAEILKHLAPCGLDCWRCADFEGGEIQTVSVRLKELLGDYGRVAALKSGSNHEFAGFAAFQSMLESLAQGPCGGCRSDRVTCPLDCLARTCSREKGVDYCFQCPSYPCEGQFAGMPLRKRWMQLGDRMKQIGVEAFYEEQLSTNRYPGKAG